jgi:hypothetical protein
MNEIEQALGRLRKAVDHLKDKLDRDMSTSFSDVSEHSASGDVNAQAIDIAELKSIKSQISNAISLMEQMTEQIDDAANPMLAESKKDHQSGES